MNNKDNEIIRYISLFSGIGGFEYGIQQSKYKDRLVCLAYSEIDKYADSIYRKRFPSRVVKGLHTHTPLGDITKVRTSDLPDFELLVGGFPCQAFSIAGKRRGFDDTRGTLFFEIARILKDKRPKYFLLENVKGLLSHDKGQTFKTMLGVLSDLGYDVKWEVLNSKNFVPQNRERIYIKGYFRGECGGEVLSPSGTSGEADTKMSAIVSPTRNGKLVSDNGTLTATDRHGVYDGYRVRRLTPVECERLQGFPDFWTSVGVDDEVISDTQRYKCLGNAVTTNVITHIFNNWDLIC